MGAPQDISKGLDLFKTLVFDNIVEAVLAEFAAPILAIPIIGPILYKIIDVIVKFFSDKVYDKLAGVIVFGSILFVDVQHRKDFDTAETGLKQIAIEKGINSPEFKAAHEIEKQALKKFGQFGAVTA